MKTERGIKDRIRELEDSLDVDQARRDWHNYDAYMDEISALEWVLDEP